jgi:hypothetical protein
VCVRSSACWIPFLCTASGTVAKNSSFCQCPRSEIWAPIFHLLRAHTAHPIRPVGPRAWFHFSTSLCSVCFTSERPFRSEYCVLLIDSIFICDTCGLLQELIPVILLSHWIKRLEDSWFKLLSHGDFLNTPTRCSVKYL